MKFGGFFNMYKVKEKFIHMVSIMLGIEWATDRSSTSQLWKYCVMIKLVLILKQFYLPYQ